MQTNKAKYHLKRIQTILNLHDGNISTLDRDIILDDIRQLYDLILNSENSPPDFKPETPRDNTYVAPVAIPDTPKTAVDSPQKEEITSNPVTKNFEGKIEEHFETGIQEVSQHEEEVHTPTTVTYEKTTDTTEDHLNKSPQQTSTGNEQLNGKNEDSTSHSTSSEEYPEILVHENESYPELFDFPTTTELSDRLASSKIEHLNKILTINDKILFINHLFNGEAIPFQESLKNFEGFYTYEEAKKYASEELVTKFSWTKSEKMDIVRQFMRQVKRLY